MEIKLTRQPLFINETLLDTTVEQPIECDALLPDYCPDIVRILKCTVVPAVTSRRAAAGRLEVEGMADITVLYVSGGDGIAKAQYKVPFARTIDLRGSAEDAGVTVTARADYVNCRAVNQRRLDIRGAVVLAVRVCATREEQAVSAGEGGGLQLRGEECRGTRAMGRAVREEHIGETLELAYGKPPIQSIVRWGAVPRIVECRAEGGRALVKGELGLHILYCSTGGTYEVMEYAVPFSTAVELEGLDENCLCDAVAEVTSLTLEPAADGAGENRNITLDADVQVSVSGFMPYESRVCSDCYSTQYPCAFHTKNASVQRVDRVAKESFSHKENLPMPENVESVLDLWCDVGGTDARPDGDGSVLVEGRLTVIMLARMTDGEIYCFDKLLDLQHDAAVGEGMTMDARLSAVGCAFAFTGGDTMEVRCDLLLEGPVYAMDRVTLVDEITVDEKNPKTGGATPGLYIYMADPGETLWEIAKRYNTCIDKIAEENPEQEGGGRRILLIPV